MNFAERVDELINRKIPDRDERMAAIESLIIEHIEENGERPNDYLLHVLTNAILTEEITDTNRMKSRDTEYPFLSDTQLARRTEGIHKRREEFMFGEVPLEFAMNVGTDGRDYRFPKRRKRSTSEIIFMDENAKILKKKKRKEYNAFVYGRNSYYYNHKRVPVRFLEYNGKTYKNIKI